MSPRAAYLSVLLYLVPVIVLAVVRSRRDRNTSEIALDIPLGAALDLLGLLVLSRVMRLETACLISRPLWIAAGFAHVLWRRRSGRALPAWPASVGRREIAMVALVVALAVLLSMDISRPCLNVDRRWHIPLVASLRGQSLPFHNVYDNKGTLAYHYAGDVLAAELQTFSGNVLHSSLALSLAHDLLFGLTAATVALLLHGGGLHSISFVALGSLGLLLTGPITVLRPDGAAAGHSYINYLRLSYRPHVVFAALFFVGFLGAVWLRLRGDPGAGGRRREGAPVPALTTWPTLVACTAALSLTDEASIGLLGLAIAAAWVVEPDTIHPRRLAGLAILAGLLAALVGANLLFSGSFAPGAPRQQLTLTPWRMPGYHNLPLPLKTAAGVQFLFHDFFSIGLVWLGGVITIARERRRRSLGLFVLFTVLMLTSFAALARLEVGGVAEEGHRFMTAVMVATPLVGSFWLLASRASPVTRVKGALVPALVAVSMGLSGASTLHWLRSVAPLHCDRPADLFATEDLHVTDCRARLGARLGETTTPEYVARPLAYWYDGCHPVFAPTSKQPGQHWAIATGSPIFGQEALETLHRTMLGADETLRATCPPRGLANDPVCAYALEKGRCETLNAEAVRCELSPADRLAILAK